GHRLAHLLEDTQETRQFVGGRWPLLEELGQGAALDQLHGEVGPAVVQLAAGVGRRGARGRPVGGPGGPRGGAAGGGRRAGGARAAWPASWACRTLTARVRPKSGSWTRRTTPMPPRASSPRTW